MDGQVALLPAGEDDLWPTAFSAAIRRC